MNPLRNPSLALLILRVPLGLYFLIAGYNKMAGPGIRAFADGSVAMVPTWAQPIGKAYLLALPFAEWAFGLLVIVGLLTRTSAAMLCLMLVSFLIAMGGPLYIHNLTATGQIPFDRNWLLLSIALVIALLGPGGLSIDAGISRRRQRAIVKATAK